MIVKYALVSLNFDSVLNCNEIFDIIEQMYKMFFIIHTSWNIFH